MKYLSFRYTREEVGRIQNNRSNNYLRHFPLAMLLTLTKPVNVSWGDDQPDVSGRPEVHGLDAVSKHGLDLPSW